MATKPNTGRARGLDCAQALLETQYDLKAGLSPLQGDSEDRDLHNTGRLPPSRIPRNENEYRLKN